jgi:hypothetical protein
LLVPELKAIVPEPAAMEAPTLRVAAAKMGSDIFKKKHGHRHFILMTTRLRRERVRPYKEQQSRLTEVILSN